MTEMKCPKCGEEFQDLVKFCSDCGTPLVEKSSIKKTITETKNTCSACGNVWYYGKQEISDIKEAKMREAGKAMACCGGCLPAILIPSKKVVDVDKCPKCGSRAVKKEGVTYEV
jgi:DNA-directed RNA polymerase subunit M/transcription elongation factor TFIIS